MSNMESSTAIDPRIESLVVQQSYPLLFITISGAHLYGFPSPDSDYDLRGVHILPLDSVIGLDIGLAKGVETIEKSTVDNGLELDLVTHDVEKFFAMALKRNGYVLEQIYSPLVIRTSPEHHELKAIAQRCITRHHAHHYLGFAQTQWRLFCKETPHRIKPLLYVFRVLLTGIHLMQTGEVEANLIKLNEKFRIPELSSLVFRKVREKEQATLISTDYTFFEQQYTKLLTKLEAERDLSNLPSTPVNSADLNDLLVRVRLKNDDKI